MNPLPTTPRCAIVVATRGRGNRIVPLLDSIRCLDTDDFEFVIVDQSEDDATEVAVTPYVSDLGIQYVRSTARGLSCARNFGAARTTAPYLVITDDDCAVPSDWLTEITRRFDLDPRTGVIFCSVAPVPHDGSGYTPYRIFDQTQTVSSIHEAWSAAKHNLPLGAGMAIRRETFHAIAGFDESLGTGARFGSTEDSDFSWRAILAGWSTVYLADVTVMHDGFRTFDELRELVKRDFFGIGGALAKYLRADQPAVRAAAALFITRWVLRFGVALPLKDAVARRRLPSGFRRPLMLLRGVGAGLRTTVTSPELMYDDREALATRRGT